MASADSTPSTVDTLDDCFFDPDQVIAALVAEMPEPSPAAAARVSSILASSR